MGRKTTPAHHDCNQPPPEQRFTFKSLCYLFCCPPCPANIAAKLAFFPPEPTYEIVTNEANETRFVMKENAVQVPLPRVDPALMDAFFVNTSRGQRILCLHITCVRHVTAMSQSDGKEHPSPVTILFSHGNAVDLGQMAPFYSILGRSLGCNVFSYDYSGYGASSGKPTEKNVYADVRAAYDALLSRYNLSPDSVVLYGQSIGTVPTVDLATRVDCAAVVLHSALMSGMRVMFPETQKTCCFDAFPSIDKVAKIRSPTLMIHGTEDDIVGVTHGVCLYEKCLHAVEPLWVSGAGHHDVELHVAYLDRLRRFIKTELRCHNLGNEKLANRCDRLSGGMDRGKLNATMTGSDLFKEHQHCINEEM